MTWKEILLMGSATLWFGTVRAQFSDSFADGDFSASPSWQGETDLFVVENSRLGLLAPAASGTAHLATPSQALHEASWEFTIQMDFTPSSSNYARIYLASDQPDFRLAINGYFVKIGNTSREVSLYRQMGLAESEIIDGLDDRVNSPTVNLRVRVKRDSDGRWELFSDVGAIGNFESEGAVTDIVHTRSAWFGVQCVFTSTRSDKFRFDDFAVAGSEIPDQQSPIIIRSEALLPSKFEIWFNEQIASSTVSPESVWIDGIGHPASVQPIADGTAVQCLLSDPLKNGVTYSMEVSGFADLSGNTMPVTNWTVRYLKPGRPVPKAVLISELLPDPTPQIGLPPAEYIELFNAATEPFDLKSWQLTDGNSTAVFPEAVLLPNEYIIVISSSETNHFLGIPAIGLVNFPSLNNAGDNLLLTDSDGQRIDSVNYSLEWYRDEDKAGGGWSLELIDPDNPCGESDNWAASEDERGGTPGEPNSILSSKPDFTPPYIVNVRTIDNMRVSVEFNELLSASASLEARARLAPGAAVAGLHLVASRKKIEVIFSEILKVRTSYQLLLEGIKDCSGNQMVPAEISFGIPEEADSLDVQLSEVLFNPRLGGSDFVELHNTSTKYIDLEGWSISNGDAKSTLPSFQLAPGDWLALAPDPAAVRTHYPRASSNSVTHGDLPSFPDEAGRIILLNKSNHVADELSFHEDWHVDFLQSTEGVSLERISFSYATNAAENWISASSVSGFATPGLPNSCLRVNGQYKADVVVVPEVFSPGTGSSGFVEIHYLFDRPGTVANMVIYNYRGVAIKVLANNITLGTEGFIRWDGEREDGSRASAGYYVIWMEYFDSTGLTETVRKRIVVVSP